MENCLKCHTLRKALHPDVSRMLGVYFKMTIVHEQPDQEEYTCMLALELHNQVPTRFLHNAIQKADVMEQKRVYELMKEYNVTKLQAEQMVME